MVDSKKEVVGRWVRGVVLGVANFILLVMYRGIVRVVYYGYLCIEY